MVSEMPKYLDTCPECKSTLIENLRHCPTCKYDAGAPNVRASLKPENIKKLDERYRVAFESAKTKDCLSSFEDFEKCINEKSGVVIAMPAKVIRDFLDDPRILYKNYEKLVGDKNRVPAQADNDSHRMAVAGFLFGTNANCIIYGALSLSDIGLPTYGQVYCRLKSIAIQKRTSFLESNSFKFVSDKKINFGDKLPLGYISDWENKHKIVLSKLSDLITSDQNEDEWQSILLQSNGVDRDKDEIIEAHIFEEFNHNAIDSIALSSTKLSRADQLDYDLAIENFNKLKK